MANTYAEGAPVRLADRDTTAADTKSGLFYPYYRGLTGTIVKLYGDSTAAVAVNPDSLPDDIRKRHQAGTDAMRQKWLDGLSEEGRNKLSAAEKKFSLRYSLLVSLDDLLPGDAPEPPRKSLTEIEEAEATHLAEVAGKEIKFLMSRDIDLIIKEMKGKYPNVCVEQLQVRHPGIDDDGLWYFWLSDRSVNVQIESSLGCCPFLIETNENDIRADGQSVAEVVHILERWLHLQNSAD